MQSGVKQELIANAVARRAEFWPSRTARRQTGGSVAGCGRVAVARLRTGEAGGSVEILQRRQLERLGSWRQAFGAQHKDQRYYEIIEDTIHSEFDYRYFVIRDTGGRITAIQPFFVLDQDLLAGDPRHRVAVDRIRLRWPRFMRLRTLMVGCAAGEGHLDGDDQLFDFNAELLARTIVTHARLLHVRLIVLKEFQAKYRRALVPLTAGGFARIPSMPMTRFSIAYADFDAYMRLALGSPARRKLRKKLAASACERIEMSVVIDVTPFIDEIYPLYLQVYRRSRLRFERLTKQYFCQLGRRMPDKARFFIWRRDEKIVAFGECLVHGDTLFAEYLGLDYSVALSLHLYHRVYRDIVSWAIAHGCKWYQSSGLNYDPKLHLRHRLEPLDLYVRSTSRVINTPLKRLLPLLEPTRYDDTLPMFPNHAELWQPAPA